MRQVRERSAHFAAAGLTITPQRLKDFSFAPSYMESAANLIYRVTDMPRVTEPELSKPGVGNQRELSDNAPAAASEETSSEWATEESEPRNNFV